MLQENLPPADLDLAFARIKATGATAVRLNLQWAVVAPKEPSNPADPADKSYRWAKFDNRIQLAVAHGLEPMLTVYMAPAWAQEDGGKAAAGSLYHPYRPSPDKLAAFARAAATRYGGGFGGLPRVRYWEAWIEPNAANYLTPQFTDGQPASPSWYRGMLNAFADAVKGVHPDNLVIAGGLSPFGYDGGADTIMSPLRFMRELLCLSAGDAPQSTCDTRVRFDIWGHHPYTAGGPAKSAAGADDASLGDLARMSRLLDAARSQGKIVSDRDVEFWVTEFSWDSDPPDQSGRAVPPDLEARWVAEAMYRSWEAGVSRFVWHQLRDLPFPASPYQGGLYYAPDSATLAGDAPKPALAAFRFPFVAFREGARTHVWGRTPGERAGFVFIDRKVGARWRPVGLLRADANGIFEAHLASASRARRSAAAAVRRSSPGRYRRTVLEDAPVVYRRLGGRARGALTGGRDAAACLDGQDDVVPLGSIGTVATIEAWVRTTRTGGAVFSDRGPSGGSLLGIDSTGWALAQDSSFPLLGGTWVADGRWHQLVSVRDGLLVRLYVDGGLEGQAFAPPSVGGAATIGYDAVLGTHFGGCVDELAVYDHPLSASRVRAHFIASGRVRRPARRFLSQVTAGDGPFLRARLLDGGEESLPFSLTPPPDRAVSPFGG